MTSQQGNRAGGQGQWIGGFAAGVLVVALAGGGWWMMQRKPAPASPAATPPPMATQPMPANAAPAEPEISHEELEKLVAVVPRISPDGLADEMKAGTVVVIDVRDQRDYAAGHIPGSLQIPLQFIAGEIPYFPRDKKIVTYCACPAEETSGHALLILQRGGLTNVAALQGGLDLWRSMGMPVEEGLPKPN